MIDRFLKSLQPKWEFFGIFKPSLPYHFYAMQFTIFAYTIYRMASRDFTGYGVLDDTFFDYPRMAADQWPIPFSYFATFQFIYLLVPRPGPYQIEILQYIVLVASTAGIFGLFPRTAATVVFFVMAHLTGIAQSSNADIEGGSLLIMGLLILALSRTGTHYQIFSDKRSELNPHNHWPVFLYILCISVYYGTSGLNKIIDVGPHWPFVVHLEWMCHSYLGHAFFNSHRYVVPAVSAIFVNHEWLSPVGGVITLVAEVGFFLVLFVTNYRWFFVFSMIAMHVLVMLTTGINFIGNSFLLLLCFDVNAMVLQLLPNKLVTKAPVQSLAVETQALQ